MIIPKDIFRTLNDCIIFLLYLRSKDQFTANDLISKFNLNKWTPYRHLSEWKNKEWLILLSTTSTKGGKKFNYSLSNKSHEELKKMCKKFVEKKFIRNSLTKEKKEIIGSTGKDSEALTELLINISFKLILLFCIIHNIRERWEING